MENLKFSPRCVCWGEASLSQSSDEAVLHAHALSTGPASPKEQRYLVPGGGEGVVVLPVAAELEGGAAPWVVRVTCQGHQYVASVAHLLVEAPLELRPVWVVSIGCQAKNPKAQHHFLASWCLRGGAGCGTEKLLSPVAMVHRCITVVEIEGNETQSQRVNCSSLAKRLTNNLVPECRTVAKRSYNFWESVK